MKNQFISDIIPLRRDPSYNMERLLKGFDKGEIILTAETKTKKRSLAQNRSMFGIPYKMISERLTELWGETVTTEKVHELMKDRFADILKAYRVEDPKIHALRGKNGGCDVLTEKDSTTKLSTLGAMRYYEEMQKWAAEFLEIDIPSPNEVDYTEENVR